jgi:pimeloyl-ACP methyl ester carboxylesterase
MPVQPFTIHIPQATLADLHQRLVTTRWPDQVADAAWDYGTNLPYLQHLVTYWRDRFDWRAQEAALNRFAHFRADVDGFGVHFIHQRGQGPTPLPLLLLHGWPDSFFRFYKLLPLLTDPARHGGTADDAFDVVVPSLPGYGFSDKPLAHGFRLDWVLHLLAHLMTDTLGYRRFGAHGGDIGSGLAAWLARAYPEALVGIHLTDVSPGHQVATPVDELTPAERAYLQARQQWRMAEGAYFALQATKPQTLAYGLTDSPAGLAAWMVEKFRAWSDCDGEVETRFSKDELLTNIMIYWATETINSSFLPYYAAGHMAPQAGTARVAVPTGMAIFPKDIVPAPRAYGERFFSIHRWTEMPRGGHFAALEEPELLAEELRTFYRPLRAVSTAG